jgi:hypothetical protein
VAAWGRAAKQNPQATTGDEEKGAGTEKEEREKGGMAGRENGGVLPGGTTYICTYLEVFIPRAVRGVYVRTLFIPVPVH